MFALRIVAALALLGLTLLAVRLFAGGFARARVREGGERLIDVVETTLLPGSASLHVVKVADRYLVVARSAGYVGALAEIEAERVASWLERGASRSFGPRFLRPLAVRFLPTRAALRRRFGLRPPAPENTGREPGTT